MCVCVWVAAGCVVEVDMYIENWTLNKYYYNPLFICDILK